FPSFFFSSRRRHTRFSRDWSSDVCSSDLDDPTLIDPSTGLPFNGQIELPLSSFAKFATIADSSYESEQFTGTRMCIGALVTRKSLQLNYGLTPAQAKQFFNKPITIHVDIGGTAQMIESASIYFGTRFVGD